MINVLLFAGIREKAGRDTIRCERKGITVGELKLWLAETCPELADDMKRVMIAVNEEFADDSTVLKDGDQVAVIPPVSGG
ncbi:molybdopterin synthase sulfur carrier subunit [Caldalkalibacillus thermarum]|uniref:molybdopterin converting factor subunit 1 n=1 Tax=Caldalkalibacillus thermarum TaxID=296745 RepID=UPI00166E1C21|nr:molybdopterin converting factor subunit 1 [Caldalkalibacillus thermarum]GGK20514.1 molybdopterin synthase sulfur carrier subunit [Caldalkalibacillus thermarum]